eukprot:scpid69591/ scgid1997/ 
MFFFCYFTCKSLIYPSFCYSPIFSAVFASLTLLLLVAVACSARIHHHEFRNKTSHAAVPDMQMTDWVLAAHGSTRMRANGKGKDWDTKFHQANFHYPTFSVPFNEGPVLPAGVNHRTSDNHIHVPILGATSYPGSTEWPAGGANRKWTPPMIWEIDGNTGKTVRIYDLSEYSACFNSVVRYTNDGYPFIALYAGKTGKGSTPIAVLDAESDKVLDVYSDDSTEPMLLQITNTEPQQIIWAALDANAGVSLTGHEVDASSYVRTTDTSTIIFGADGQTIYNNGFFNHNTGIFKFALPLTSHLKQDYFVSDCNTRPWVMASDTKGNAFALCGNLNAYDANGKQKWSVSDSGNPSFLVLSDAEDVLFAGNGQYIKGLSPESGEVLWSIAASEFGGSIPVSAQPWAPRYPIPLPTGNLAVLVVNGGVHSIALLDSHTGKIVKGGVTFDFAPQMLTADNSNNVYAFGNEDGYLKVQRKSLGES